MREALLGLEVANQLAAAAFCELSFRKRNMGGGEVGGDVCSGGLFAYHEDLGMRGREG